MSSFGGIKYVVNLPETFIIYVDATDPLVQLLSMFGYQRDSNIVPSKFRFGHNSKKTLDLVAQDTP